MAIRDYIQTRNYIVVVKDTSYLESLYEELETKDKAPEGTEIFRNVVCVSRRPNSKGTIYNLTKWEAAQLKNHPNIRSVELAPSELGIKAGEFSISQYSEEWDKSAISTTNMKNWALLRCVEGQQRTGWGGTGYEGNETGTANQSGTITLSQTGKNVDVVIVDGYGLIASHPEYTVNPDGTGGSRYIQYNWFQHQNEVGGLGGSVYPYSFISEHATHVAGTVAGNTQGWARNANIYNIFYNAGTSADNSYDPLDPFDFNFPFVMDYVREFHRNKPINPITERKNPTITNNSWGMSVFPQEWSFADITAVTYRGVRYTLPEGFFYTGFSGVCSSTSKLADLLGLENFGNRITTGGSYNPPGGDILSYPVNWILDGNFTYILLLSAPSPLYTATVQGPGTIVAIHNVAAGAISGIVGPLFSEIVIKDGDTVIQSYSDGPYSSTEGGDIETDIVITYELPDAIVYTIEFKTSLNTSQSLNNVIAAGMSLRVEDDQVGTPTASVEEIPNILLGAASLTSSTTPTYFDNDDGAWELEVPWSVSFLGNSYNRVNIGTNFYVTFGDISTVYDNIGPAVPNLPKICMGAADRSTQRIYHGTEGTAPNRTFRVRIEGHTSFYGAVLNNPTMVCEYIFYENNPAQIDLQIGTNQATSSTGTFTTEQLNSWGLIAGRRIPQRVSALDSDIEQAIDEGILFVGAAGNGRWKHDIPGGPDWDNSFEMALRYPASVDQPYYYMRGTSPTANDDLINGDYDIPNICVGAVDSGPIDQKVIFSDCGPGVDIWAPGTYIISAYPDFSGAVNDPRDSRYKILKASGTSMASPQVCGVLACALEIYPNMTQEQAKDYIISYAKQGQLTASTGGPTDYQDLQGAPNLLLYYYKERPSSGNTFPKINFKPRPISGAVFPRTKIRRS